MLVTPTTVFGLRQEEKVRDFYEMGGIIRSLRHAGLKVVLAQGVFDIVHAGHVGYLRATARAVRSGTVVVTGIESDASVRANKGGQRPINPADDRMMVLSEFESVHLVFTYPGLADYDRAEKHVERYRELAPNAVAVPRFDPYWSLKHQQADRAGTGILPISYQHINSTTLMLRRLGHEE